MSEFKETDYYKSDNHINNAALARAKAAIVSKQNKAKRIEEYNLNPKLCDHCSNPISYEKRSNNFCSRSCSASKNNTGRVRSEDSLGKTSETLKEHYKHHDNKMKGVLLGHTVYTITCKICGKERQVGFKKKNHKTCGSSECKITASIRIRPYVNGKRKTFKRYCSYTEDTVTLESSWEVKVADFLDENNVQWSRPQALKWIDSNGKNRYYFPDFYLPDYNVYLDPKNPFCMEQDKEKLKFFLDRGYEIIFGDIKLVLEDVESLIKQ